MMRPALCIVIVSASLGAGAAALRADATPPKPLPDTPVADAAPAAPMPVVFDGFGLDAGAACAAAAAAVHDIDAEATRAPSFGVPLDIRVRGPAGSSPPSDRLAAEVRSRLEGIDLTAGLHADPAVADDGPARWIGGVGMCRDHDRGREAIEVKTSVGRGRQSGILGLEVGPRIERRLPHGRVFFLDGRAEAQAQRTADGGDWMLPRLADQRQDGAGMLGVAASTGFVR